MCFIFDKFLCENVIFSFLLHVIINKLFYTYRIIHNYIYNMIYIIIAVNILYISIFYALDLLD